MTLELGPTRQELQALAEARLREARALLAARELDGAYYLGGYAVEFALKAAIVKRYADRFPPKKANDI